MALQQPDAITVYQQVVEDIPQWKSQISELAEYAADKHGEFVAEYSKLVHHVRTRKQKSASITSLRSEEEHDDDAEPTNYNPPRSPQPSELADIDPLEAGNRFIYAQARGKRRPGTSIRSNLSGPRNIPRKQMVVIYYDSHIQCELDKLVKAFGSARNNVRKGKNAYTVSKGFASILGKRYDSNFVPNPLSKAQRNATKPDFEFDLPSHNDLTSIDAAFAQTDKELDAIQTYAETAAHQMLRNGDCKSDLASALQKLDSLLVLAQSTLDKLRTEKASEAELENDATYVRNGSDHMSVQSTLCEKPSTDALYLQSKLLSPILSKLEDTMPSSSPPKVHMATPVPLVADAIEVDEGEDDDSCIDIDLNIAKYRAVHRIAA